MSLRSAVKDQLPPAAQDALRTASDLLLPSRRETRPRERPDELAATVSPTGRVLAGPFEGLQLTGMSPWGGNAARLAGTYEREIVTELDRLLDRQPSLVLDLGAADGYYATGIARRLPKASIVAFEMNRVARRLCRRAAAMNGLSNVQVKGRVTPSLLRRYVRPGALVICDVEGYEDVLIDPAAVPDLIECDLLVELHEFAIAGVTERIVQRFQATHEVRLVDAVPRTQADAAGLRHMDPVKALHAVQEGRPSMMQWAVLTVTYDAK